MAKTPTVTLYDPKRNQRIKVDRYQYTLDVNRWINKGYTRVESEQRGDATPDEQAAANRETKIQRHRENDAQREKQFGDKQRAYDERSVSAPSVKAEPEVDPEWKKLPWFPRRQYVKKLTGTTPKSMAEAETLMADFE